MMPDWTVLQGDCRAELAKLPEKSVHCCVTSPPYHGLRDYGLEPSLWGNGWSGVLGLERHVDQYVRNIVECFRAVKRVLRDDGTLWIVVGDRIVDGQFAGVTWKLAEAMKADRWLLRCPIVWFKTDANMDSAGGRPRMRHEYVLVFAKSTNHYFDQEAVEHLWRGSVWPIATSNVKGEHFAPYPRQLVDKCVRLGTSERGCCPECGAPWIRTVSSERAATRPSEISKYDDGGKLKGIRHDRRRHVRTNVKTLGWRAGCKCLGETKAKILDPMTGKEAGTVDVVASANCLTPVPCTVLDIFLGSGTTLIVANQLGRRGIGIEASPEYCAMARRRIANPEPEPEIPDAEGQYTFEDLQPA